ncbi:MAG: hypothetical protein PVJ67_04910 [Candidatus Pacearchaeota archaeon]
MEENFKCPDCKSSLFHVEILGNGRYLLKCYKTRECGWKIELKEE